ncbi:uncharacterized protein TRAVEDRAFT_62794 [Trametes versicolor FP-101664 SS1]|uniref:uncharacterized protein n=1 Tax=Trametes versicolor (strain FP-101664) TaxID=717944 RepID=UPI0004623CD1|nr:uncharacterized protein TRAVEDRAFT_62794 [Trametes versicolor FP-101664 SS1]EIW63127.1 hypothetical protein TRAVEDRAFT_62794 [Trametes versicolor FP-101664 SS1]
MSTAASELKESLRLASESLNLAGSSAIKLEPQFAVLDAILDATVYDLTEPLWERDMLRSAIAVASRLANAHPGRERLLPMTAAMNDLLNTLRLIFEITSRFESVSSLEERHLEKIIARAGGSKAVLQDDAILRDVLSAALDHSADKPVHPLHGPWTGTRHSPSLFATPERHDSEPPDHSDNEGVTVGAIIEATVDTAEAYTDALGDDFNDIEDAASQFAQLAPALLDALQVVADIHPFAKITFAAFHAAYKLYVGRKENDKQVTFLHETDNLITKRFQRLFKKTESDIKHCSHECTTYTKKTWASKLFLSPIWAMRLSQHVEVFRTRKTEFRDEILNHIMSGVNDIKANLGSPPQPVFKKQQCVSTKNVRMYFQNTASAAEQAFRQRVLEKGSVKELMSNKTAPLEIYEIERRERSRVGVSEGPVADAPVAFPDLKTYTKELYEDPAAAIARSFNEFEIRFGREQQRCLEYLTHVVTAQADRVISSLRAGPHDELVDDDMKLLWEQMHWGRSEDSQYFSRALREHYREKDKRCEIPIRWLAFKTLAWQWLAKVFKDKIDTMLAEFFWLKDKTLPENLEHVDRYLHKAWPRIHVLTRSFYQERTVDVGVLPAELKARTEAEVQLLRDKLLVIRYRVADCSSLYELLGTECIEQARQSLTVPLHPNELESAITSLESLFHAIQAFVMTIWTKRSCDSAKELKEYACGLFDYWHDPSTVWSRRNLQRVTYAQFYGPENKEDLDPEDVLYYTYGEQLPRSTSENKRIAIHFWFFADGNSDIRCANCFRDVVGARTVCMDCGMDVTKTVNFCQSVRCRDAKIGLDLRPDLASPHLATHAMFKVRPVLHLRDFAKVDVQARDTLRAARNSLRIGAQMSCCGCGSPALLPCWACISCPDVFLCDKYKLLQDENHTRKHGVVRFQDEQAVIDRRLEAVEEKLAAVVKGLDALNGRFDGLEELLQKTLAVRDAEEIQRCTNVRNSISSWIFPVKFLLPD